MTYEAAQPSWWSGRQAQHPDYLYQHIRLLNLEDSPARLTETRLPALLGYACEAGVARNQGRVGAAEGPNAIREALGKLPLLHGGPVALADAGNIRENTDMEGAQKGFANCLKTLLETGYFPIGLGGGHDMAYAHYMGLRGLMPGKGRLGMINFDAHLDLRQPVPRGHSGSPYHQMAADCEARGDRFSYACVGVRADANTQELLDRASQWGVLCLSRDSLGDTGAAETRLLAFCESLDAIYLSIDLDGFTSAFAPGVSAASPMGFTPQEILPLLRAVWDTGKVVSMDLAEMNPGLDRDGQTARLAASLIHTALHHPGLL
ncbi:formimidoylglutamase [Robiginitalea sp. M366]|uniref:formimidoylglutamase n=1 Tax=Robiginitalea aestuariiviva TaxID=3036903 RepID=UPI00240E4DA0|nr:formimidoylglutamase [Robiginitalea aestuariiviva]MDG1571108.1 formimidoylglutamase [Robiginitalea aestuariiviva]